MKTLTLLRHAKSDWSDGIARDIERPLNAKGATAAATMGRWMASERMIFDLVLASPAVRVAETLDHLSKGYGRTHKARLDKRIYLASAETLIETLRECGGDAQTVMLCGHNPGMEDLALELVPDDGSSPARAVVEVKFPTGSIAELALEIDDWRELAPGTGRLLRFIRPRDLNAELGPGV